MTESSSRERARQVKIAHEPRGDEREDHAVGAARIVWLTVAFAVIAGLGELLILLLQGALGQHFSDQRFITPHAAWKTPLSYLAVFALPGAVLAVAAATRLPILSSLRFAVFAFTGLTLVGWLGLYGKELHLLAIAVLAAGVAIQAARLTVGREDLINRSTAKATGALVLLVLLLGTGIPTGRWLAERRARADLPAPAGETNVLLIILDTVRAANLSLYGYGRPTTPLLERWAERGVVFDAAIAPTSWTLPTHASLFTGHFPHRLTADWAEPLSRQYPTLATALSSRGYLTGGFVANREYCGLHTGLARGFQHYDMEALSPGEVLISSRLGRALVQQTPARRLINPSRWPGLKPASTVTNEFLGWLDSTDGRPFFAFLNYFDAHTPYRAAPSVAGRFADTPTPLPDEVLRAVLEVDPEVERQIRGYDEAIATLDEELSHLFGELEKRGLADRTLVIVTSDHGEEFGEKGVLLHGRSLNPASVHVPLVMRLPGKVPEGLRLRETVSLRDLAATVVDLLGIDDAEFPGNSLAAHWTPEANPGDDPALAELTGRPWLAAHNPASRGDMASLTAGRLHYIRNGDGVEELFDIGQDPWALQGPAELTGSPEGTRLIEALRATTDSLREETYLPDEMPPE